MHVHAKAMELGIGEHHCDTLLAASCLRVVIKIIVKKRGNKKSIIVPRDVTSRVVTKGVGRKRA